MRAFLFFILLTACSRTEPLAHKALQNTTATVDIYLTQINDSKNSRAWCYKTSGMQPQEVTITVILKPGESEADFPQEPIKLLNGLVLQKATLEPTTVADLQGETFLNPGMTGLLIVQGGNLPNVPGSENCLTLVGIFQDELDVADLAGPSRVMGALALQTRYYPCPVWCDRDRSSTFTPAHLKQMKAEPTSQVFPYHSDASVMTSQGRMSLRIRPQTGLELSADLAAQKALRLGLDVDPRANAFLIWTPDKEHLSAVNPHESDGSLLSGQYIVFLPEQKQDECRIYGDGYVVFLTDKSFQGLIAALKETRPFRLGLTGDGVKEFALEWVQTDYYNPLEKTTYSSKSGWTEYKHGTREATGIVALEEVVLLTPERELARSLSVEALTTYIKELEAVGQVQLESLQTTQPLRVLLQCDLTAKTRYQVAIQPPPEGADALVQDFYSALAKVKVPPSQGPAKFHLIFTIKPRP